ncbi:Piso0_001641 [Millerozyma farinosa CBS 7064]|uniref:Piso0_001641 protein n=1 Tax=Pichia sorbitophila (strain ATCC MYA-4447 / BCRC 22081 / CBS 7064 / NBRC 10061 / NRRL Y-12695) TaxID=559304 RepID=G8YNP7_PICSO|nr:Piso0_001641 [Millerozyma farinosa CBS 7064]
MGNAMEENIITLPKASFTAFRLIYQSSRSISESSKCVLLGKIPDMWVDDGSKAALPTRTYAKNKVKKKFRSALATVDKSVRGQTEVSSRERQAEEVEGGFNHYIQNNRYSEVEDVASMLLQQEANDEEESQKSLQDQSTKQSNESIYLSAGYDSSSTDTFEGLGKRNSSTQEITYPVKSLFFPHNEARAFDLNQSQTGEENEDINENPHDQSFGEITFRTSPCSSRASSVVMEPGPGSDGTLARRTPTIATKSTLFSLQDTNTGKLNLDLQSPSRLSPKEIQEAKSKQHHIRKKLKTIAKSSKGEAKKGGNLIRRKIYNAVLRHYKTGEILKIDKMLVMVKETYNFTEIHDFNENEPCDARVYERWKEYIVVIRKTEEDSTPLCIQMYDRYDDTSFERPSFQFSLSYSVSAQFYSSLDRSISISVPNSNGLRVYILKCADRLTSIKWLYFIKQYLCNEFTSVFRITLGGLNLKLDIYVPERLLVDQFHDDNDLKVTQLVKGYSVQHATLVEYLKERVLDEVSKLRGKSPAAETWLSNTKHPWFCFRQYDRIEWIIDNGRILSMKYPLLSDSYEFEMREREFAAKSVTIENEATFVEPIPVEGFLARLTNISGYERNFLKTFHKVSYFFSCGSVLFFTKFFRAVPPSPENVFIHDKNESGKRLSLPIVYEHNPFPLDESDHIAWLDSDKFEHYDQLALEEFERRAQQMIKAEAMIDILTISDVRRVPMKKNMKAQNLLLCLIWYSSPHLINDEATLDSCFEIETQNGGIIKLQAPSRATRDEWVSHLLELKDFWKAKASSDLNKISRIRASNQAALRIDEYADSNITYEDDLMVTRYSKADPQVNNMDNLAMKSCILMNGYLYQKGKKHSNFNQYYVVLCPGFLILFSLYKRSKITGAWKKNSYFEHYLTIPISESYVYSGGTTELDLLNRQKEFDPEHPNSRSLPRIYPDGWKSSEEESLRCFTLWFGKKREIVGKDRVLGKYNLKQDPNGRSNVQKNPGLVKMIGKLGVTGKSVVFMARSRQERELWVSSIFTEIDRFAKMG